jgi:signal transduction histidine kinase
VRADTQGRGKALFGAGAPELRDPALLRLRPMDAYEHLLRRLVAIVPLRHASLWRADAQGRLRCIAGEGRRVPGRRARTAAVRAFAAEREADSGHRVYAFPIVGWGRSLGALAVQGSAMRADLARLRAVWTADMAAMLFDREDVIAGSAEQERLLVKSGERRLARLGLDLHDGPLQTVAALAADVRHFRSHLAGVVFDRDRERVLGCVDDLAARLIALDGELRELLHDHGAPLIVRRPFSDILREQIAAFESTSATRANVLLEGDFGSLTESQRIVLIRFVQEALTNVRAHSGAARVEISLTARETYIEGVVADDGRGFEVEPTLARVMKDRRLGLAGMRERARFLGGGLSLDSRVGGPTTVSVVLPAWRHGADKQERQGRRYFRRGNR